MLLGHFMEVEKAGSTQAYTLHQVPWSDPPGSFLALMSYFHTTRLSHVTPRDFFFGSSPTGFDLCDFTV